MQKSLREIFNSTNLSIELHATCKPICKPSEKLWLKYAVIAWVKYKIYNKIDAEKYEELLKKTLEEYDNLCGIECKYISTRRMAHLRQRADAKHRQKRGISKIPAN